MPSNKRKVPEPNAAPMADIAFLLLIFFLVVTTFDTDKGIQRKLPPLPKGEPPEVTKKMENVFIVLVNSQDQLLVEGEPLSINQLKEKAKKFVDNRTRALEDNEDKDPIISLKNDRGTSYDIYIQVQNELTQAYNELRNDYSQRKFGNSYYKLQEEKEDSKRAKKKLKKIKEKYPMKISEAEPEKVGG